MGYIVLLVVIGTSIWVLIDAQSIGVRKGLVTGVADMGPVGWFIACLGIWILAFPFYLAKRDEFKQANLQDPQAGRSVERPVQAARVVGGRAAVARAIPMAETTGGGSGGASIAEEIGKLGALRDKGYLSEEEFQSQKQRILGGGTVASQKVPVAKRLPVDGHPPAVAAVRPPPPSPPEESVNCPMCGRPIPVSGITVGRNTCPHCGQDFIAG